MSLVNFGFLIGMLSLAIPIIIHLLNRWQIQRVELGTMRFLSEVIVENSSRRRVRRWLLLCTRLIIFALLVFLFARPYLSTTELTQDEIRIILIDRSGSMGMPGSSGRLIDDAIAKASEIASRDQGGDVFLAVFDRAVHPVENLGDIDRKPVSLVGATNYDSAIAWARDKIVESKATQAEVAIISDFQQTGLVNSSSQTSIGLGDTTVVELIDVGRPAVQNLAITRLAAPAKVLPAGSEVRLEATLFNFGSFPAEEVELTVTGDNGRQTTRTTKTIDVQAEEALEVSFELGVLGPGTWQISAVSSLEDDLFNDNERRVAIQISEPISVAVIGSNLEDSSSGESLYLKTALEESQKSSTALVRLSPDFSDVNQNSAIQFGRAELAIVANASELSGSQIQQLSQYASRGGNVLIFSAGGISKKTRAQFDSLSLSPGALATEKFAGTMPFRITKVSNRGDMLAPFRDAQTGDLSVIRFSAIQATNIRKNTEVLAWFDDQSPAITRHEIGTGQVVWFMSGVGDQNGNWATSRLYVPVLQQIIGDMLALSGEGPVRYRSVGDAREVGGGSHEGLQNADSNSFRTQEKEKSESSEQGELEELAPAFERPGFEATGRVTYVVNSDARESDPSKLDSETFIEAFDLKQKSESVSQDANILMDRDEIWPWLAAALIALLVAEFCLANRTAS